VSTTEELLGRKSSGTGLESRECGRRDPSHYPRKLALTSPTSGGSSVGIVRLQTQAREFSFSSLPISVRSFSELLYNLGDITQEENQDNFPQHFVMRNIKGSDDSV
jgi:hypothetical protein